MNEVRNASNQQGGKNATSEQVGERDSDNNCRDNNNKQTNKQTSEKNTEQKNIKKEKKLKKKKGVGTNSEGELTQN